MSQVLYLPQVRDEDLPAEKKLWFSSLWLGTGREVYLELAKRLRLIPGS